MFTKKEIRALLVPLVLEQILTGLMGVADTLMVARVGEAAISGVALVDSVNMLFTYFFSALAAGGTIICAQYIGHEDDLQANRAAHQVMSAAFLLSVFFCVGFATLRRPVLRLIFGTVETSVMEAATVYALVTALSYPFLAVYTASAALFRSVGDSRRPMVVAAGADMLNIAGNALLIFGFGLGVLGAALATLASRIVSAVVMVHYQRQPGRVISLGGLERFRPDRTMLRRILRVGLPSAVENGMFQFGKLVVQSTVSVLGTTAIAAQAMVVTLESMSVMPGMAIGTGLITVAGQCIGAGRPDEARRYMKMFTRISVCVVVVTSLLLAVLVLPITGFASLSPEGRQLACQLTWFICVLRMILWPRAFTLPNGLRAAGDVSYAMWTGTLSMWIFRVGMSWYLCRYTPVGLWGVWIGWCTDWAVRAVCFSARFKGSKWTLHHVLD